MGGKEVLIKAVLQAIPTYAMSCFRIPASVCKDIESICANFWWGEEKGRYRMHWMSWDKLCRPKGEGGMGFRKMQAFNKALLAKQLWRIIHQPDSLVARILKGRYFRHQGVLEAPLGNNPSYVWRSILWSRDLLKAGLYWRIGDGQQVRTYEDKWIPSLRQELALHLPAGENDRVQSLIANGQWNSNLLNDRFPAYVSQEIQRIPLPTHPEEDIIYWLFEDKGTYSVRSGYRKEIGFYEPPSSSSENRLSSWWKWLWSLNLPPKIKIFFWRVSNDIIPTTLNLSRHHVPVDERCQLCGSVMDTTLHSLLFCRAIVHFWKATKCYQILKTRNKASTMELCDWLRLSCSKVECEDSIMQMWAIWKVRQKKLHEGNGYHIASQISGHMELLEDFRRSTSQKNVPRESVSKSKSDEKWKLPENGSWRLDVDTCYDEMRGLFGTGGIIRGSDGLGIIAFGQSITKPQSVVDGELLAIREGLKVAKVRHCFPLLIASDSLLAVQAVTNPNENLSHTGILVSDISKLMDGPETTRITHVRRSANMVAHHIAKFSSSSPLLTLWEGGTFPFWLTSFVLDDLHQ